MAKLGRVILHKRDPSKNCFVGKVYGLVMVWATWNSKYIVLNSKIACYFWFVEDDLLWTLCILIFATAIFLINIANVMKSIPICLSHIIHEMQIIRPLYSVNETVISYVCMKFQLDTLSLSSKYFFLQELWESKGGFI